MLMGAFIEAKQSNLSCHMLKNVQSQLSHSMCHKRMPGLRYVGQLSRSLIEEMQINCLFFLLSSVMFLFNYVLHISPLYEEISNTQFHFGFVH